MADHVTDTLEELKQLQEDRKPFEDVWEEITRYLVPNHSGFQQPPNPSDRGRRRGEEIYDGTPQGALNMWSAGTMGHLMGASFDWFALQVPDEQLMDNREVRMWLSKVDTVLFGMIARSNFYREMYELFRGGGSIGTATIFRRWDEATQREQFKVLHPREIYVAEDANGDVDTVFRYTQMTNKQIVERFAQPGDTVNPNVVTDAMDPTARHKMRTIIHAVKPNPAFDPTKADKRAKKFLSSYIEEEHQLEMRRGGFDVLPYAVWRVLKEADEEYGRGPAWEALGTIKGLYEYARTDIEAAQLRVNRPLQIPEEMRGKVKWVPGGRNYFEDANRLIVEADVKADLLAGLDREERNQRIIERAFLVDFFLMFAQSDKEMTATEIRQRREEKSVLLGPNITSHNADVLDPLIDGIFNDAWNAGLIEPPPQVLVESLAGRRLEVDYKGPLVQSQKSFFQLEPYRQALGQWAGLAEVLVGAGKQPDFLDNYDMDFVSREMFKSGGGPEEAMLDPKIVAQLRQQRAEAQQRQQQLAAMEQMGKAAPGLNQPVAEGSILEQMEQGQAAGAGA